MTEARASVQRPRRRDPPRSRATEHKGDVRAPIPLANEETHTDLQEDTKPEENVPTDGHEMEHPVHGRLRPTLGNGRAHGAAQTSSPATGPRRRPATDGDARRSATRRATPRAKGRPARQLLTASD